MKIHNLSLENFRRFYGRHEIAFATGADKNVTLIVGNNSFGKSTLFEALYWLFVGETQDKEKFPEEGLLSATAEMEKKYEFCVKAEIELDNKRFRVIRKAKVKHLSNGKKTIEPDFKMVEVNPKNGTESQLEEFLAKNILSRAMPPTMADYFFIHGEERAKKDFRGRTSKAVSQGISKILGCDVVEKLIEDLAEGEKQLEKLIIAATVDQDLKRQKESLQNFKLEREAHEKKIGECDDRADELAGQIEELDAFLGAHKMTKEHHENLQRKRKELADSTKSIESLDAEVLTWTKTRAISAVSHKLVIACADKIDIEEVDGKLPPGVDEVFVSSLLKSKTCVCGRPLEENSPECAKVKELLEKKAVHPLLVAAAYEAKAGISLYTRDLQNARETIQSIERRRLTYEKNIGQLEKEIADLDELMAEVDIADVKQKQADRNDKSQQLTKMQKKAAELKADINNRLKTNIEHAETEVRRLQGKTGQATDLEAKRSVVERLQVELASSLVNYKKEARAKILTYINEVISKMWNEYKIKFDEDFNIELVSSQINRALARSEGEDQLVTLAYVSGLIRHCAERAREAEQEKDSMFIPGTVAPLVLDAPLSKLDSQYRAAAADVMTKQAEQVILFLTPTQLDPEVQSALQTHVGALAILRLLTNGPRDNVKGPQEYNIFGRKFNAVETSDKEYCELKTLEVV